MFEHLYLANPSLLHQLHQLLDLHCTRSVSLTVYAILNTHKGAQWSYVALLVYEFILTFDSEINLFWKGAHLSGPSILFIMNRYLTLASQALGATPVPFSVEVCWYASHDPLLHI